jgi:hypothetical protein
VFLTTVVLAALYAAAVAAVGFVAQRQADTRRAESSWCHLHAKYARTAHDSLDVARQCGTVELLNPGAAGAEKVRLLVQNKVESECDLLRRYARTVPDSMRAEARCGPFQAASAR